MTAFRLIAREALPALLVLYPILLLLDDLEPGFVRSVVNPHVFLLVLVVAAMLAPRDGRVPHWSLRTMIFWTVVIALSVGVWMWWKLGGGALGAVVALLSSIAVYASMWIITKSNDAS